MEQVILWAMMISRRKKSYQYLFESSDPALNLLRLDGVVRALWAEIADILQSELHLAAGLSQARSSLH